MSRSYGAVAYEMPRAGAARALRLIDADGHPLDGSLSQPKWELKGGGLFFTRESAGTRNIWRAFPDPQDNKRYPTWRALPVTSFKTPVFATSATPIPGAKALAVVSNASSPNDPTKPSQIARYDLRSSDIKNLTDADEGAFDPAVSPDGQSLAFASTKAGSTSVYVQSLSGGAPRRLALNARRPTWQDNSTLLLESVGNPTIFRLSLSDASRPLKMSAGEQIAVAKDGAFIAYGSSVGGGPSAQMRLFLMAGDGSGLRAITDFSTDARRPALAPDGKTLAFDAPLSPEDKDRTIWIMPLERGVQDIALPQLPAPNLPAPSGPLGDDTSHRVVVENPEAQAPPRFTEVKTRPAAPTAQITGVDVTPNGGLAVLGSAAGEDATAFIGFGSGNKPSNWITIPIALPLKPGAPLALWTPPVRAKGTWTIRVTISNEGGAAQSSFSIRLPIKAPAPVIPTPAQVIPAPAQVTPAPTPTPVPTPVPSPVKPTPNAGNGWFTAGGPLPNAPLPDLPGAPVLPHPAPSKTPTYKPAPTPSTKPPLPLPRPATPTRTLPSTREVPNNQALPPSFPSPTLLPPVDNTPAVPPVTKQPVIKQPTVVTPPVKPAPTPVPAPATNTGTGRDAATFNISGTLASMAPNQNMKVTFWGVNKGDQAWDVGSAGQFNGAVRLVARWVDFDTNNRKKWSLQWMKTAVAPGGRTSWDFDVTAPSKPGRYKLIYGLVRMPNENWQPPAYNARQEVWPNEFAAIAFAVTVK